MPHVGEYSLKKYSRKSRQNWGMGGQSNVECAEDVMKQEDSIPDSEWLLSFISLSLAGNHTSSNGNTPENQCTIFHPS